MNSKVFSTGNGMLFLNALFLVMLAMLVGCGEPLMPTPSIYARGEDNPFEAVPPSLQGDVIDVLYVTDRTPVDGPKGYGTGRSLSLAFGSSKVQIGNGLTWEELVQQSRMKNRTKNCNMNIIEIKEQDRLPNTPQPVPHDFTELSQPTPTKSKAAEALKAEVRRRLSLTPDKQAYVFIHGFNDLFSDGVFITAEMWHFLGRKGVPIAYTWPAGVSYAYDTESSEYTIYHLKQLLKILAEIDELEKVNVIAHSRGTYSAVTALCELLMESDGSGKNALKEWKINNVILAAPDLDISVIGQRASSEWMWRVNQSGTIYVNPNDKALGAADLLFKDHFRLGQIKADELTDAQRAMLRQVHRINIIRCDVPTTFLGHSYFHNSPYVSSDLIRQLQGNKAGSTKRPLKHVYEYFWILNTGYPHVKK